MRPSTTRRTRLKILYALSCPDTGFVVQVMDSHPHGCGRVQESAFN